MGKPTGRGVARWRNLILLDLDVLRIIIEAPSVVEGDGDGHLVVTIHGGEAHRPCNHVLAGKQTRFFFLSIISRKGGPVAP